MQWFFTAKSTNYNINITYIYNLYIMNHTASLYFLHLQ